MQNQETSLRRESCLTAGTSPEESSAAKDSFVGNDARGDWCEADIRLELGETTERLDQVAHFMDCLTAFPGVSLKAYRWSPHAGWVITASVQPGRRLIPLVLQIPDVYRIREDGMAMEPAFSGREKQPTPERSGTLRKTITVWLHHHRVPLKDGKVE